MGFHIYYKFTDMLVAYASFKPAYSPEPLSMQLFVSVIT